MPTKGVNGVNTSHLFWLLEIEVTRKEIVEAIPIAKMMKQDMYVTVSSLSTQEQNLFLSSADYSTLATEADRVAYVKISQAQLPNLGAEAAGTTALLQKQLGVIAIALLR